MNHEKSIKNILPSINLFPDLSKFMVWEQNVWSFKGSRKCWSFPLEVGSGKMWEILMELDITH